MNSNSPDPQKNPDDDFFKMFQEMFGQFFGEQGQSPHSQLSPEELSRAFSPEMMQQIFAQVQAMFTQADAGGPINWEQAENVALQVANKESQEGHEKYEGAVKQAFELAELWLDQHTTFPARSALPRALTAQEWISSSMSLWRELTEPVATAVAKALSNSLKQQLPEELAASLGPALPMLENMGGAMFAVQLGQAMGKLSTEMLGTADIGLPTCPGQIGLLPQNVAHFADGLEIPVEDVFIYLALRESAYQRLFAAVPWLNGRLKSSIQLFASGFKIDTKPLDDIAQHFDPMNPEAFTHHMEGTFLEATNTPQQQDALKTLETQLALIEGWVEDVVTQASANLPSAAALREMMRRHRATGGPSQLAFAELVGLEFRPRRLRDAANLWAYVREQKDYEERDRIFAHPSLHPSGQELDDPIGFVENLEEAEDLSDAFEEDIRTMLAGGFDNVPRPSKEEDDAYREHMRDEWAEEDDEREGDS